MMFANGPACRNFGGRIDLIATGLAVLLFLGCFHSPVPYRPRHWPHITGPIDVLKDQPGNPVLQVLIAYNVFWPNHTALRLVDAAGNSLFWDPGGGYGKTEPGIERHSDLIWENVPDLPRYMVYRWANQDRAVEIFEWRLHDNEARRLASILRSGVGRNDDTEGDFRTATPGFFCNAAISSFLYRYGPPSLRPGDSYFLPSLLSRELYQLHPDRVLILERDQRASVSILTTRLSEINQSEHLEHGSHRTSGHLAN